MASGISSISPNAWNQIFTFAPSKYKTGNIGHKLHKGANMLDLKSFDDFYSHFVYHWHNSSELVIGVGDFSNYLSEKLQVFL